VPVSTVPALTSATLTEPASVGAAVAARRRELGLTQGQLAALLGTTASAICRLERDHQTPATASLCRLSEALDLAFLIENGKIVAQVRNGGVTR
jgi:transcriptional regulator with XRE-family HTH domain